MRRTAIAAVLVLCCSASYALAQTDRLGDTRSLPPKGYSDPSPAATLPGGDTFATATVIPALPYADGGTTCGFVNDYNPPCVPSNAPDVVYRFTPATNVCVNVSLCNSLYDTELVIYQNNVATVVACQDDSPQCGLQSHIEGLNLLAGNTYYIVIDGYATACGTYSLSVTACPTPPPCPPCPPTGVLEGEPACFNGYVDNYNAGCNSTPPTVTRLPSTHIAVCGSYGTYNNNGTRDTDWYEFTLPGPGLCNVTATVEGPGLTGSAVAIIDNLCPPNVFCGMFTPGTPCAPVTCSALLGPGTYRIFTASFFDNTPCGSNYVLTITNDCPTGTQASSTWGSLKALYR